MDPNLKLLSGLNYGSENLSGNKSYIPDSSYNFLFMTLDELAEYWNSMRIKFALDEKKIRRKENQGIKTSKK